MSLDWLHKPKPSDEKQLHIIRLIDDSIVKYLEIIETLKKLRTMLLLGWHYHGDEAGYRSAYHNHNYTASKAIWYLKQLKEKCAQQKTTTPID